MLSLCKHLLCRRVVENGTVQDDEALQEINKRIAAMGKSLVENSVENVYNLLYLKLFKSLCEPLWKTC